MAKGNRLLVAALLGLAQQPINYGCHAQAGTANSQQQPAAAPQPVPPSDLSPLYQRLERIDKSIQALEPKPESPEESRRAEGDLRAQEDMAWWAKWMTIANGLSVAISALGVIFLILTLRQNRRAMRIALASVKQSAKSALITREIGEAQTRAYMTLDKTKVVLVEMNGINGVPQFHFSLTNSGNSPARKIKIDARCDPVEKDRFVGSTGSAMIEALSGGTTEVGYVHIGMQLPEPKYDGEIMAVRISVRVAAVDVFKKPIELDQDYFAVIKKRIGSVALTDWSATGVRMDDKGT